MLDLRMMFLKLTANMEDNPNSFQCIVLQIYEF